MTTDRVQTWKCIITESQPFPRMNFVKGEAQSIPLEEMDGWKWRECCDEAVKQLDRLGGHEHITSGKTIMIWHHSFRENNELFLNLRFHSRGKIKLHPLLEQNPKLKMSFVQYATANLNELLAELLLA